MKLIRKFVAALMCALIVVVTLNAYLRTRQDAARYRADLVHDHQFVGRTLREAYLAVRQAEGERAAEHVLRSDSGYPPITVRVVALDRGADPGSRPRIADERIQSELAQGGEVSIETPDDHFVTYFPLPPESPPRHALEISESIAIHRAQLHASVVRTIEVTALMLAMTIAIALALGAIFIARPVRRLVAKARRIGDGDLAGPIVLQQHDELSELAVEINLMAERLAQSRAAVAAESDARLSATEQLRHSDRLRSVGQLASGIAHELGTPLAVVRGRAQLLRTASLPSADVTSFAAIIEEQCDRMSARIRELLDFARRRAPTRQHVDLRALATHTVDLLEPLAMKQKVELVDVAASEPVFADVDPPQIEQVITNLAINAIQAMSPRGTVRIEVAEAAAEPPANHAGASGRYARIAVTDDGPGIAPETLHRIFEPFFTTKDVGTGTGLGLSVAYAIVQEHGGWIDVESALGRGSRFVVNLPLTKSAGAAVEGTAAS